MLQRQVKTWYTFSQSGYKRFEKISNYSHISVFSLDFYWLSTWTGLMYGLNKRRCFWFQKKVIFALQPGSTSLLIRSSSCLQKSRLEFWEMESKNQHFEQFRIFWTSLAGLSNSGWITACCNYGLQEAKAEKIDPSGDSGIWQPEQHC